MYVERIEALDRHGPRLLSVIELNPEAMAIADALDHELRTRGPRGPLHGIPVLLKDNIDTADQMLTTAGSLALMGSRPRRDAFVVQQLREAGRCAAGQDEHERMGQLPLAALLQRLERARRAMPQPVRPAMSHPAAPVPARRSPSPPALPPWRSEPRLMARSSAPPPSTRSSVSSRRLAWSAGPESSPSPIARTPLAPSAGPSPTRPHCSGCWPGLIPEMRRP